MDQLRVAVVTNAERPKGKVDLVLFAGASLAEIRARDTTTWLEEARQYALEIGCYLVPGLYVQEGYLCSCLIDPHGNRIGEQKATHLHSTHFPNAKRSDQLHFLDSPWGKLFLAVDVDVYKPEVIRIAVLSGVKLVIAHQYIEPSRCTEAMIRSGVWQQAQQNCIYILQTSNCGSVMIAPCQATDNLTGIVTQAEASESLYGECSMARLEEAYRAFPIFDSLHPLLYQKQIKPLCE